MISARIDTEIWLGLLGVQCPYQDQEYRIIFGNVQSGIPMKYPIRDTLNAGRNITLEPKREIWSGGTH